MSSLKKQKYRNRNGVRAYLSDKSFEMLDRLRTELGMSASDILETGLVALMVKRMTLETLSYEGGGDFKTTKERLKAYVAAEVIVCQDRISTALDRLETEDENG